MAATTRGPSRLLLTGAGESKLNKIHLLGKLMLLGIRKRHKHLFLQAITVKVITVHVVELLVT